MDDPTSAYAKLVVPQRHVKRIKSTLESVNLFNKKAGIERHHLATETLGEPHVSICTRIRLPQDGQVDSQSLTPVTDHDKDCGRLRKELEDLGLTDLVSVVKVTLDDGEEKDIEQANPVLKALQRGLRNLPQELLASLGVTIDALVGAFPASYTIYSPMLLLPHNTFTSTPWTKFFQAAPDSTITASLWETVASAVGVTHIAVNAGIPPQNTTAAGSQETTNENILRSPTNLTPIHGFFGPPPSDRTLTYPTSTDFKAALWTVQVQNGISQTWAPLYTMFSRGNIREKARVLNLPSVATAVQDAGGCTAVDLYAGIGYFAFSYRKAGVSKVLCWELNPWSIEGLCRGANLNGWKASVHSYDGDGKRMGSVSEDSDFLVFPQSNETALAALPGLKEAINMPAIRHVNCGFLPSSKLSWSTAVGMIDEELGGWVHAHENVGVKDLEKRKTEVEVEMKAHLDRDESYREVKCQHVEKVKTYAPGVLHVVFDVWIGPAHGIAHH